MTWDHIRAMSQAGIEFAAHTSTHVKLSHVDMATAQQEILHSQAELQRQLDRPCRGFAYPYGNDVDAYRLLEPVFRDNDFDYACTTRPGNNGPNQNPYLLNRITLPLTTSSALIGRILCLDYL